jgi:acyl-CoA synthetase (AMP-forming)/AMP-acid ligase II
VEIEVRDDAGGILPAGEVGEIWVRGEQVAGEYVDAADRPDQGWFRTKDVAYVDDDGFVFLQGRADDVIVRGGENLSPGEIEDVLLSHPAISEAAVVGRDDDEWGQVPVAFVVTISDAPPSTSFRSGFAPASAPRGLPPASCFARSCRTPARGRFFAVSCAGSWSPAPSRCPRRRQRAGTP